MKKFFALFAATAASFAGAAPHYHVTPVFSTRESLIPFFADQAPSDSEVHYAFAPGHKHSHNHGYERLPTHTYKYIPQYGYEPQRQSYASAPKHGYEAHDTDGHGSHQELKHISVYEPKKHSYAPVYRPTEQAPVYRPVEHAPVYESSEHTPIFYKHVEHIPVYEPEDHSPAYEPRDHSSVYEPVDYSSPVFEPVEHNYFPRHESVEHNPVLEPVEHNYVSIYDPEHEDSDDYDDDTYQHYDGQGFGPFGFFANLYNDK